LHVPDEHVVTNLQAGGELHAIGVPVQTPAWQLSPVVQAFPSSQVPLFFTGFEQIPVVVSHVPALWHWSGFGQVPGAQVPVADEQVAHPEHAFPVFPHCPLPSQVWGWEPLHRLSAGEHSPVQPAVVLHTFEQVCGSGVLQVPALHVPAAW
jgi:hypothetical protein